MITTYEQKKKLVESKGFDTSSMSIEDVRQAYKDLSGLKSTSKPVAVAKKCNDKNCKCNKPAKAKKVFKEEATPVAKAPAAKAKKGGGVLLAVLNAAKEAVGDRKKLLDAVEKQGFVRVTAHTYLCKRKELFTTNKNGVILLTTEGKALLKELIKSEK